MKARYKDISPVGPLNGAGVEEELRPQSCIWPEKVNRSQKMEAGGLSPRRVGRGPLSLG